MTTKEALFIEDDDLIQEMYIRMFSGDGRVITVVSSVAEAVRILKERRVTPDVIVSDSSLLDGRGDEVLAWIICNRPELVGKFIFNTGDADKCKREMDADVPVFEKGNMEHFSLLRQHVDEKLNGGDSHAS